MFFYIYIYILKTCFYNLFLFISYQQKDSIPTKHPYTVAGTSTTPFEKLMLYID